MEEMSVPPAIYEMLDLQDECLRALTKRSWTQTLKEAMIKRLQRLTILMKKVRSSYVDYLGGDDVLKTIEEIRGDVGRRVGVIPH